MKRIAILVIAATTKPLYEHYIKTYWSDLIKFTNAEKPNVDVFLLFENAEGAKGFEHLSDNIIIDQSTDFNDYYDSKTAHKAIPGILSKTIYAFKTLQGQYDVYFRTNLSSMVNLEKLETLVESKKNISYSGGLVWKDALRQNMTTYGWFGPDKKLKSVDELAFYKSNTFISGSGYLLSSKEAAYLIANQADIRYDIPDDVAVGLMMESHEHLPGFSLILKPNEELQVLLDKLLADNYYHVRLQHFPLEKAQALWNELRLS